MNTARLRNLARGLVPTALLLLATSLTAQQPAVTSVPALQPAAELTLQYQQSDSTWVDDGEALFGHYVGSGRGIATGALQGTVRWDLYEDQSRNDLHPALFRGFVERAGRRHQFQIIGVYTPEGSEKLVTPAGHETFRRWTLSGTVILEDSLWLGARHAPVTGSVDISLGTARHTVWVGRNGTR